MCYSNFLLNMVKTSLPLIKLALMKVDNEIETNSSYQKMISEIYLPLTSVTELLREKNYQLARDLIVKTRADLINIKQVLLLSPESQSIFEYVLNHLACINDELFYRYFVHSQWNDQNFPVLGQEDVQTLPLR